MCVIIHQQWTVIWKRRAQALWGLALLLLLSLPAFAKVKSDGPFAGIPNLTFQYYWVSGRDLSAIRASMNAQRPTDPHDGKPDDALTVWSYRWNYTQGPRRCQAKVFFSARVMLPRLRDESDVPAKVAARWRAYMARLEVHEAGHARIAYARMNDIRRALRAPRCATGNHVASAILDQVRRDNAAYDDKTHHGMKQGAVFP